jgi:DNA-directed RNA polymerase subunit RPC12/RpoP
MKTHDQFVKDSQKIFGVGKFSYPEEYQGAKTKIQIKCLICHNIFNQKPNDHLSGHGCRYCYATRLRKEKQHTAEIFINKSNEIHGEYTYDNVTYTDSKTPVLITCKLHGDFHQVPATHLQGSKCPHCSNKLNGLHKRKTTEEFILRSKKIFGHGTYDYHLTEYVTARKPITIVCFIHGPFIQIARDHLSGYGCPNCAASKGELKIEKILKSDEIQFKRQFKFKNCVNKKSLPFDFGIFDKNQKVIGLIEYHGEQHYKAIKHFGGEQKLLETKQRDIIKQNYCKLNNIPLLIIPYTKFKTIETEVKNFLANL